MPSTNTPAGESACKPDPAAAIAATPAGGTWTGSGCYLTDGDVKVTKPITITSSGNKAVTFDDEQPVGKGNPIINIVDATDVTVSNLILNGTNPPGPPRDAKLVGQSGIQVFGSSNVNVDNVTVNTTGGDGMTVAFKPRNPENTNIHVNGFTANNVGRIGVTVAYATDSTFSNVTIIDPETVGVDFESDLPTIGAGNITFTNLAEPHGGVRIVSDLSGPVTFNQSNFAGRIILGTPKNEANTTTEPITFNGGTILVPRSGDPKGPDPTGINVMGPGTLMLNRVTLGRIPGARPASGPAWSVTGRGRLTLVDCPVSGPIGIHDGRSAVTIRG